MKLAAIVSLLAGIGAIIGLFLLTDPSRVWDTIAAAGWWIPALAAAHFFFVLAITFAWRSLLLAQGVERPFLELYRMRWIADAIDALVPLGVADGEVARGYIQAKETEVEGPLVAAVIVVELTARLLALVVFIGIGLVFLAIKGRGNVWLTAGGASALLGGALGGYWYAQRHEWLGRIARRIGRRSRSERWQEFAGDTEEVSERIAPIYEHRGAFLRSTGWHFAGWVIAAAEIMFMLWIIGHPTGPLDVWILEAIGQAARNAGFFLPAALGAAEGGYYLGAKAIGLAASVGLAVAIIKRIRDIVFGIPALLLWQGTSWKKESGGRAGRTERAEEPA